MDRDREPGETYALDQIGFIDFESLSKTIDLRQSGAYCYACDPGTMAIMLPFAIGAAEPVVVAVDSFDAPLHWDAMPPEFHTHQARVEAGEAVWASWSTFDRPVWNYAAIGFPKLEPHHLIDIQAQATASGLAPDLATASKQAGGAAKLASGKNLINIFSKQTSTATPQSHPLEWAEFIHYARFDIISMRDVFLLTRQLTPADWAEFWVSEKINERGIAIDLQMVTHAAKLAEEDARRTRIELPKLTEGAVGTANEVAKITKWLMPRLPAAGRDALIKREEEKDEEGVVTKPAKMSLTKQRVEKLITLCSATPGLETVQRVLELRLYGGSKSSAKFAKMLLQHIDGTLYGQFVFSGAPMTGRFSSKGVQIQNLSRSVLKHEHDLIEALLDGVDYDTFAKLGGDEPVAKKLALLVRPAFIAPPGKVFVWSDSAQIEARLTPFLAGTEEADRYLDGFRRVDADPSEPDLYVRTAADISGVPISSIDKPLRQRGKVTILACGFAGGANALQNMGVNYGLYLSDVDAKAMVDSWREANPWAVEFWNALWEAVEQAILYPGVIQRAGRIHYVVLDGSLLAVLPSGRVLTYRNVKYEEIEDLDEDDKPTGRFTTHLRFSRGHGRSKIWRGTLVENVVQAAAADFLRGTLRRLSDEGFDIRAHAHDEIVLQAAEDQAEDVAKRLHEVMCRGFSWSQGLPLNSDEKISPYYTKSLD
jgi:DNA polymerase